jgi:hypothetical protein
LLRLASSCASRDDMTHPYMLRAYCIGRCYSRGRPSLSILATSAVEPAAKSRNASLQKGANRNIGQVGSFLSRTAASCIWTRWSHTRSRRKTLQGNIPSCMANNCLSLMQGSTLLLDPWKNLREELHQRLWFGSQGQGKLLDSRRCLTEMVPR